MHLIINPVTISKFELWFLKFFYIHFVTFEFAGLLTVDDVILLSQILISPSILEEHSVFPHVKWFNFDIFFEVPYNYAVR